MFSALGRFVVRYPGRIVLVWLLVIGSAMGLGAAMLGEDGPESVMSNNQTDFLPKSYESAQAAKLAEKAFPQHDGGTATLVMTRADGRPLSTADSAQIQRTVQSLQSAFGHR